MNREQAQELLPIIQAFAEGKTVQYLNGSVGKWSDAVTPSFFTQYQWRIKPEPREFYLIEDLKTGIFEKINGDNPYNPETHQVIKVREVLSD